ncbi:poly [ADP-ribose] polymerase 2-like isoform X2 [Centruroides vittatus]|uniref:poly [ADP-ribose] polymerase 2-like isoform X2 n=1 Tax=Centruroides vittatus TaxID=120091 RepID=UPI00350F2E85
MLIALNNMASFKIGGPNKTVEIDETVVCKRKCEKDCISTKWVVRGICREDKNCFICQFNERSETALNWVVDKYVNSGSIIITDGWKGYNHADEGINNEHRTVNHSKDFVNPKTGHHTQNIEQLWGYLKNKKHPPKHYTNDISDSYMYLFMYKKFMNWPIRKPGERFQIFIKHLTMIYSGIGKTPKWLEPDFVPSAPLPNINKKETPETEKEKATTNLNTETKEKPSTSVAETTRSGEKRPATSEVESNELGKKCRIEIEGSDNVSTDMGKRKVRGNLGTSKDNVKDNAVKNSKGNKKLKTEKSSNSNAKEEGTSKAGKFDNVTIPVDEECPLENVHVYCEDGEVFNAMLNQTNVQNNNNKYYLLQLLKRNSNEEYFAWFRWGRVGKKGQSSLQSFESDLDKAKACFEEKFLSKTKNKWENRNDFVKYSGKYDLLQMDYNETNLDSKSEVSNESKKIDDVSESELKKELQDLMNLIFDLKAMEEVVKKMNYDAKKSPLGKLTKEQISSGFLALKRIESCINSNNINGSELVEACNDFYTKIPHDFGMKRPPLIKTVIQLKEELELIETLEGIEIALNMMNEKVIKLNPIDYHYKMLDCELEPLEHSDKEFEMVELYVQNTHGETHRSYSLSVTDVFKCSKSGEDKNFRDYGNKMLLWHGSRLSNWPGILKQGLRIAPPEAPVTGYMFGKGVYFADMCSKSANYCHAIDEGLLLLCEVSLGNQNKLKDSNYYANNLPEGKHSVMGMGKTIPNPEEDIMLPGDVKVTLGKPIQAKGRSYSLLYNEYIVYDVHQIKMRYLVRAKFNYGK